MPQIPPRAPGLLLLTAATVLIGVQARGHASSGTGSETDDTGGYRAQLVHHFERNEGQADPRIDFLARGRGYALLLEPTGAVLQVTAPRRPSRAPGSSQGIVAPGLLDGPDNLTRTERSRRMLSDSTTVERSVREAARVRMKLVGGNPEARGEALEALPGRVNYLTGRDRRQWKTGVPTFGRVRYSQVYPGIDLVYYGREGQLEYDFVVAPGADPGKIRLQFEGLQASGAGRPLRIDAEGALVLSTGPGEIRKPRPVVYQEVDGQRRTVAGAYRLEPSADGSTPEVTFRLGKYDPKHALTIDPVIVYSTYLGGTEAENYLSSDLRLSSIAADAEGCAYVAGTTSSPDFPVTPGAFQTAYNGPIKTDDDQQGDVFVAKISADGSHLVYATYLGGNGSEAAHDIAVDDTGCAYVTGHTTSVDFPMRNAYQSQRRGPGDAYITKLNPSGSDLVFSTYLGGTAADSGRCITVSSTYEVAVAGTTVSFDFPLQDPYQDLGGLDTVDIFVTRFSADGSQLGFSTYLGGNVGPDEPSGMAVDPQGGLYICGTTSADSRGPSTFPTHNPIQSEPSGPSDFIAAKFTRAGELQYSTFLGGASADFGRGIAVDEEGNAYLTGYISSKDFPRAAENHTSFGPGPRYACVIKLNPTGSELVYTTFITANLGIDIGLRQDGNVYVVGDTDRKFAVKTEMPPNFQRGTFVARLNPTGTEIVSTSFILAAAQAIAVDPIGNMYLTGDVYLRNFETANALQPLPARKTKRRIPSPEITDAFVTKITSALVPPGGRLAISPVALNFGTVVAGQTSAVKKIKLRNTGRQALIVKVGWTPAPFTGPATGPEIELIPGVPHEIQLTFTPPAKGRFTGKLSITSTDLRRRVATINLTGRGK